MPLNADQLDAFWMVAQTGSFHRAADALYITQSAVTQRVQALEGALGRRLFVRAGRGVTLTDAGQRLVRYCRDQRQAEAALLQSLETEAEGFSGRLAIATGSMEGHDWVLPVLTAMGREHPDLDLSLTIDDTMDPLTLLEGGLVDVVLSDVPLRRRGLECEVLGAVDYVLVAAPDTCAGWSDRPQAGQLLSLRAIDFDPSDRITLDHLSLCLPGEDFSALRRHFVNHDHGIVNWVRAGGGFSVLPRHMVDGLIADGALRLLHPDVRSRRTLYWAAPESPPPAVLQLLDALRRRLSDKPC